MNTHAIRGRFGILRREVALRALGALLVAGAAAPLFAPLAGAEDAQLVPGQPPAPGQIDADYDGLNNSDENVYGLNPYDYDTDNDGIGDGDEFYNRYGYSYPNLADSDYDGLADGTEVFVFGSDPIRYDTDGDGYSDGQEFYKGTNPRDARSY